MRLCASKFQRYAQAPVPPAAGSPAAEARYVMPLQPKNNKVKGKRSKARPVTAIGCRVKSGWAMTVLVGGSVTAPRVLDRRRIELSDPTVPATVQPYHAAFGTEQTDTAAVRRPTRLAAPWARRARALRRGGPQVRGPPPPHPASRHRPWPGGGSSVADGRQGRRRRRLAASGTGPLWQRHNTRLLLAQPYCRHLELPAVGSDLPRPRPRP